MIEQATGDLLRAEVEALVNPVNCTGVMGKGLARQFRRAFPENFRAYIAVCRAGMLRHSLGVEPEKCTASPQSKPLLCS